MSLYERTTSTRWKLVSQPTRSREEYERARRSCEALLERWPEDARATALLGLALHRLSDERCVAQLRSACERAPSIDELEPYAVLVLASRLHAAGRADEARRWASALRALVHHPRHRSDFRLEASARALLREYGAAK